MGEKMAARNGNKSEKRKEIKTELEKDEKELKKAKKNDRVDGSKDSVDSSEGRKEKKKKKRHKDGKKERVDRTEKPVVGQRNGKDCGDVPVGNGEEERPKKHKKGKREKEDSDNMVKDGVDDERKHSKERKCVGRESKDDGKVAVNEKNADGVCDKPREDITGSENENGEEKSKKKKERRKRGDVSDDVEEKMKVDEDGKESKRKKKRKNENTFDGVEEEVKLDEGDKSKKKKKKKMESENMFDTMEDKTETEEKGNKSRKKKKPKSDNAPDGVENKTEYDGEGDKRKKKKAKSENVSSGVEDKLGTDKGDKSMNKKKKSKNVSGDREDTVHSKDADKPKNKSNKLSKEADHRKDKKKKAKAEEQVSNGKGVKGKERIENEIESDTSENPTPKRKSKSVSFSDEVEVFDDGPSGQKIRKKGNQEEDDLVQGKRFSKEEDELVKEAVLKYIEEHNLGDDGLHMVLNCKSFPEIKNCWKEIAKAIPWRPHPSVYYRAHVLFERSDKRKWTQEEKEYVLKFYKEHGADWKKLSTHLDKHRFHCKDTWRRIKLLNRNKGRWKQEEYQNLFDLVNTDLSMRALEERKYKHGMIRDNICWEAISDRLATRTNASCCLKWYKQLTSPMVDEGLWADTDDYRLLDALTSLDACSLEDVDWDCLLEHREGHICRKRWNQMVKHISDYTKISFSEQVEVLAKRYNPDYLQAREEFDNQPLLP